MWIKIDELRFFRSTICYVFLQDSPHFQKIELILLSFDLAQMEKNTASFEAESILIHKFYSDYQWVIQNISDNYFVCLIKRPQHLQPP